MAFCRVVKKTLPIVAAVLIWAAILEVDARRLSFRRPSTPEKKSDDICRSDLNENELRNCYYERLLAHFYALQLPLEPQAQLLEHAKNLVSENSENRKFLAAYVQLRRGIEEYRDSVERVRNRFRDFDPLKIKLNAMRTQVREVIDQEMRFRHSARTTNDDFLKFLATDKSVAQEHRLRLEALAKYVKESLTLSVETELKKTNGHGLSVWKAAMKMTKDIPSPEEQQCNCACNAADSKHKTS